MVRVKRQPKIDINNRDKENKRFYFTVLSVWLTCIIVSIYSLLVLRLTDQPRTDDQTDGYGKTRWVPLTLWNPSKPVDDKFLVVFLNVTLSF